MKGKMDMKDLYELKAVRAPSKCAIECMGAAAALLGHRTDRLKNVWDFAKNNLMSDPRKFFESIENYDIMNMSP